MPVQPGLSDLVGNPADRFSYNVAQLCLAKESHEHFKVCFYVELKKKSFYLYYHQIRNEGAS